MLVTSGGVSVSGDCSGSDCSGIVDGTCISCGGGGGRKCASVEAIAVDDEYPVFTLNLLQ